MNTAWRVPGQETFTVQVSEGYDPAKAHALYIAWRLVKVAKAGGDPELLRQQIAEFEETLQDFLR